MPFRYMACLLMPPTGSVSQQSCPRYTQTPRLCEVDCISLAAPYAKEIYPPGGSKTICRSLQTAVCGTRAAMGLFLHLLLPTVHEQNQIVGVHDTVGVEVGRRGRLAHAGEGGSAKGACVHSTAVRLALA